MSEFLLKTWVDTEAWLRSAAAVLTDDERGQGMVEYALILFLISIVAIVILGALGVKVNTVFNNVNNAMSPVS
ncbi:MAG: Flp family type IVb pilin [Chloroflexi bacterium]|nr:Flp family type IVb pilin [Chloroflexota bacterium]